jgi:prolyl 4-hydroxylase
MVLRAADRGGATTFSTAGFEVSPPPGGAVFFRNLTAAFLPDPLTLHAGAPVEQGEKVVMTYWQRERDFA